MTAFKRLVVAGTIWMGICVAAVGQSTAGGTKPPAVGDETLPGYRLFDHNCAHCHGDDARGDEGPDLHDLRKSDARIEKIIKNGIKGEMPSFGRKFSDADVQALIAWLRTLKA
jgi:mono/diheme cytochrome c family protein